MHTLLCLVSLSGGVRVVSAVFYRQYFNSDGEKHTGLGSQSEKTLPRVSHLEFQRLTDNRLKMETNRRTKGGR